MDSKRALNSTGEDDVQEEEGPRRKRQNTSPEESQELDGEGTRSGQPNKGGHSEIAPPPPRDNASPPGSSATLEPGEANREVGGETVVQAPYHHPPGQYPRGPRGPPHPGFKRPPRIRYTGNTERYTVRFLIPKDAAGVIIGKQGVTIKALREATGAVIKITDYYGYGERIILIQTPDPTTGQRTLENILVIMRCEDFGVYSEENLIAKRQEQQEPIELKLLSPASKVGGIIGKGGVTINGMREKTNTVIRVAGLETMPPGAIERIVTIQGLRDNVVAAQHLVNERLQTIRDPPVQYQQQIPPGYQPRPPYQQPYATPHGYQGYNPAAAASAPAGAQGYAAQPQYAAGQAAQADPATAGQYAQYQPQTQAYPQPPPVSYKDLPQETVSVPEQAVGRIIGKGGSTVTDIRNKTGCNVSIHPQEAGQAVRIITLTGIESARETAKYMIRTLL